VIVLALDTSSLSLCCAVAEVGPQEGRALAEALIEPPARHGDVLPGALFDVIARAGLSIDAIEGIAVGLGPGSFTGLRVGLASAKALAYARRLPLAGCSSLLALERSAGRFAAARALVPTTEARKGELYARLRGVEAAYRAPQLVPLLRELREPLLFGPGALACRAELREAGAPDAWFEPGDAPRVPPALQIALECRERLHGASYDAQAVFALGPNYVKQSEAELALAEGRVGKLPQA
jgi:tRNA threonylcarbamoyladenosine biosynthesis protein TsaB